MIRFFDLSAVERKLILKECMGNTVREFEALRDLKYVVARWSRGQATTGDVLNAELKVREVQRENLRMRSIGKKD